MEDFIDNENYIEDESNVSQENDTQTIVEAITSGSTAQIQALQDINQNYVLGSLGIVACLGFVFGALLGSVYDRIFRK